MKKTMRLLLILTAAVTCLAGCSNTENPDGNNGGTTSNFDVNSEITVISREDGSGTRGAFIELFGVEEENAEGEKVDNTVKPRTSQRARPSC